MRKNIGTTDKVARLVIAAIILLLYFTNMVSGVLAIVLLITAIIMTGTSLLGFCPLYLPFGVSSLRKKSD